MSTVGLLEMFRLQLDTIVTDVLALLAYGAVSEPVTWGSQCFRYICTVKPVLNGISRDQNIFPLKPGFRLIKVHYIQYKKLNQDMQTLTLRRLMSYIYGAPILDVSRSHTTTQHSR